MGRVFDRTGFKGDTTLIKMHTGYQVDGADKRAAYEISVGDARNRKHGVIYITRKLVYHGFQFFNDREGHSLLVLFHDKTGKELYGAHVPLQSLKQKDGSYLYITGTKEGPGFLAYPQEPLQPLYALQVTYVPTQRKEREGDTVFRAWPFRQEPPKPGEKPFTEGTVRIGEQFKIGDNYLSVSEVRYWVMMSVRYEPGKPVVLTSLWVGLGGMIITFIGRMMRGGNQRSANSL
jgi:hypothetical protein